MTKRKTKIRYGYSCVSKLGEDKPKHQDYKSWCRGQCFVATTKTLVKDFFDRLIANGLKLVPVGSNLDIRITNGNLRLGEFVCWNDGTNVSFKPITFMMAYEGSNVPREPVNVVLDKLISFLRPVEYQSCKRPYYYYGYHYKISYKTLIERQDEFIAIINEYRHAVGAL